jgi:ribosomal protein S19E (S16A)
LLRARKQGRHKYFALSSDEVAHVLEGLMGLAARAGHLRTRTGPRDTALRKARVCYNHLAGDMGTRLFDDLVASGYLRQEEGGLALTQVGRTFVRDFGIDIDVLASRKAPLCRECLDWSERRSHLAGSLGRAFLRRMQELGWARRDDKSRVVRFTTDGERAFAATFARQAAAP